MLCSQMVLSRLTQLSGQLLSAVLDPTIVLSFDRTGFLLHQTQFRAADLDVDMQGKSCLVTGANDGLGRAAATALARRGADVWLLCRDPERGEAAQAAIRRETGNARVSFERIDLASLASVREFAARFNESHVDVLINSAALLPDTRQDSLDGIELGLATNVIGPFLLMHLLLPKLRRAQSARVINVATAGIYTQRLSVDELMAGDGDFDGVLTYTRTKRAQVVLAELWSDRLNGTVVTVNSMHPGLVDIPAVHASLPRLYQMMGPMLRTPEEGADTIVWLAVSPRLGAETGQFWFDREPRRTHLMPWTQESPEERERLWQLCCRLSGVELTPANGCGTDHAPPNE